MSGPLTSSRLPNSILTGGVFNLTAPVPTDGQPVALQVDASGNLLVNIASGGGAGGVQYVDGVTQVTPTGTVAFAKNASNVLHALTLDSSGNLNVNLANGTITGGNAAAGPTGSPVPSQADYTGFNSSGNLVGVSTANPLPVAQQGSVAVTGTFFQVTQPVSIAAAIDVSDRIARLLGHVTVDNFPGTQPVSGTVAVSNFPATQAVTGTVTANQGGAPWSDDVTDRAARLLGVVYGSLGQQLKQTATNFNSQVELATGATLYDARQIRALTSSDVVTVAQPTAASLNATVVFATPQHVIVDSGSVSISGTASVSVSGTASVDVTDRVARLLGHVTVDNSSIAVTGTFFQVTQPVSIAAAVDVSDRVARLLGHVTVDNASLAVTGTFFQATQPVSIAANVGVTQQTTPWTIQGDSASGAAKAGNPVQIGGVFNTAQPTVTTGQTVELQSTARGALIVATGTDAFAVNATQAGTWTVQPGNTANTTPWLATARVVGNTGATVDSTAAAGAAPTNALLTSGIFNTTIPAPTAGQALAMQADSTGAIAVSQEGRKATYRMSVRGFAPVASATAPIFSIQGSATKTVRINRLRVSWSCTTGTALPNDISLQKFSALTGGTTGNTPTGAKNDTNNAAQTAICLQYSAVPTTATVIGGISAVERMTWLTAGVTVNITPGIDWQFGYLNEQALVLRGTAEFYGLVLAAIGTTPLMSIYIEWTEE